MATRLLFEVHAPSVDNEVGIATGWLQGDLSDKGRGEAKRLGDRHRHGRLSVVMTSDLRRAVDTARIAFADSVPILLDWRLRECNYGRLNGADTTLVHGEEMVSHLDVPYPGGESWTGAIGRALSALRSIAERWDGHEVLVIGHKATGWALQHALDQIEIQQLLAEDVTPRGLDYVVDHPSDLVLIGG